MFLGSRGSGARERASLVVNVRPPLEEEVEVDVEVVHTEAESESTPRPKPRTTRRSTTRSTTTWYVRHHQHLLADDLKEELGVACLLYLLCLLLALVVFAIGAVLGYMLQVLYNRFVSLCCSNKQTTSCPAGARRRSCQ